MDHTEQLAKFASGLRYEELPGEVVARAKMLLQDTVAVACAGVNEPGIRQLMEEVREWGGVGQSSIVGCPDKVPAPNAAFVNGAMGHALDFDDIHDEAHMHVNICVVPALLAMSEAMHISGREFLAAYVVGLEIASRLALAGRPHMSAGWLPTTVFGCFGAASAVGRILALSPGMMRHAFGIAYSHAGGNRQGLLDGALTKRIQPGIYAKAGLVSARLAKRGVTGAHNALDGAYGLYPLLVGKYDLSRVAASLGDRFEMMNIGLKLYPSCRSTHRPVDCALELACELGGEVGEIDEVVVTLNSPMELQLVGGDFLPGKSTQVNAQFSVKYAVAVALLRKKVLIRDFLEEAIRDPDVAALAHRVRVALDTDRDVSVDIKLADGRSLGRSAAYSSGHPAKPMSENQLFQKVVDCLRHGRIGDADARANRLVQDVSRIERTNDVAEFVASLAS